MLRINLGWARGWRRSTTTLAITALTAGLLASAAAHAAAATAATSKPIASHTSVTKSAQLAAIAQARTHGKPVPVASATTPTSTLTANPDGTLTLAESAVPVRVYVGGVWHGLDATLVKHADGTIGPRYSVGDLLLSGGGTRPLATMIQGINTLQITLPVSLPSPTLSGASATYPSIAPGVNLVVTANTQGGFSDVFVVENHAAATSPALGALLKSTVDAHGLTVSTRNGAVEAGSATGHAVFASDGMAVWDSSTSAPATANSELEDSPNAHGPDLATVSSPTTPGTRAHIGAVTPSLSGSTLTLVPDANVLRGMDVTYPVDIDPTWNPTEDGWSTVAEEFPTTLEWDKTPESQGYMAVGDGVSNASLLARSMVNFSLPSATLSGSSITSADFYVTNEYSGACADGEEDEQMDVDSPTQTLNASNASWDDWDTAGDLGSQIGYKSFAYGYSASCPTDGTASSVEVSLLTSTFSSDVTAGKTTQTLALVADDESSENSWKDLISTTAQLVLTYDFTPTITSMASNGKTACTSAAPALLGKGFVDLSAGLYQRDGSTLTAEFRLYNSTESIEYNPQSSSEGTTSSASTASATSGAPAVYQIPQAFFNAFGTSSELTFAWTVSATDGTTAGTSSISTCYFTYDPTVPGQPTVKDANGVDCETDDAAVTYTVGTPATFTISPNLNGTAPGSYRYQLNGAAPLSRNASSGDATIKIAPSRGINILTVTALSPTGNIGDSYTCDFNAIAGSSVDKNLTGSGVPDLLAVGGTGTSLAPGLWLDAGLGSSGAVSKTATNIGINGNGYGQDEVLDQSAGDFNGERAITGEFTGDGLQDVLTYNPSTGYGQVLTAPGDGSPLPADSGNADSIQSADWSDANGDTPIQLANAYDAASSGQAYPDLVGTTGDTTHGYYLAFYPDGGEPGGYVDLPAPMKLGTFNTSTDTFTAQASPDGSPWNQWEIATAQVPSGSGATIDMYLWNTTTNALYLWTGVTVTGLDTTDDTSVGCNTITIEDYNENVDCQANYTAQYEISTSFTPGAGSTLEAAYFDTASGTDLPDLWAVTPTGTVTPYLLTAASTTGSTFTPGTPQSIDTADHTWALNDHAPSNVASNAVTTARDTTSGTEMDLSATAGPTWASGSLFKPDVAFDGSGYLYTNTTSPVTPSTDFTISLWVDPTASNGVVLSENGKDDSLFLLYPTGNQWTLGINNSSTTSWSYDATEGGSYTLDTWTHLMLTYDQTDQVLSLYENGSLIGDVKATNVPSASADGDLLIGADQNASESGIGSAAFTGEIADVQTWDSTALTPAQNYSPPSYHQAIVPERLLDTRNTTGDTLTDNTTSASTPVASDSTTILDIAGDTVTPAASGGPTTIPNSVTAVAVDITATSETAIGYLVAYADGTQQPVTSATNYAASGTVTGYEIVPVGADGKIAIYNSSNGTTQLIVDITGYYTSDATLTGDQTYHPLTTAYRALNTATSTANTTGLTGTGPVAAGKSFTLQITGVDAIPTNATAVAINLTSFTNSGLGIIEAYQTGITEPTDTSLTYDGGQIASLAADVSIGTGGTITISNSTSSTDIIGDISGYFTTDQTGEFYHSTAPTRIVDTRIGVGGTTGALAANGTYAIPATAIDEITTTTHPTLAIMLTATVGTSNGVFVAYPGGATMPGTSNLNWSTGQNIANLALIPVGTTGTIAVTNDDSGTAQLVVDCSGFFASS